MKLSITITTNVPPDLAHVLISDGGRRRMLQWLIATCAEDAPGTTIKFTTSRIIGLGEQPSLFDEIDEMEKVA